MAVRNLAAHLQTHVTPQSEPIPGEQQVLNSAKGYVYQITPWQQLQRFLILGSSSGTYYVSERKLTLDNAAIVGVCLVEDPQRTIDLMVAISDAGRAPSNDPVLMALALATCSPDAQIRKYAYAALPSICRIPTHLFHFMAFRKAVTGGKNRTSRGLRQGLASWYLSMDGEKLAYECLKYQQRDGWSNRDLLRISHAVPTTQEQRDIFDWVKHDRLPERAPLDHLMNVIERLAEDPHLMQIRAAQTLQESIDKPLQAAFNIGLAKLTHEMVPSQLFKHPEVWEALLESMPLTAMIRNLGVMSNVGLLTSMSRGVAKVTQRLRDSEYLRRSRIHPMQILTAMKVYQAGRGLKGSLKWTPVQQIVDALDDAFYLSFGNVIPTGKRLMLALDISGSMSGSMIGNSALSCREAAAALALITARVESDYVITGFTEQLSVLNISPRQRLDDVVKYTESLRMGSTDCAQPMLYALKHKQEYDAFITITDNESWFGNVHPIQALRMYREKTSITAKLLVNGMTSTGFSICDGKDPLCLDVVGFDTATPNIMSDFIRGE